MTCSGLPKTEVKDHASELQFTHHIGVPVILQMRQKIKTEIQNTKNQKLSPPILFQAKLMGHKNFV